MSSGARPTRPSTGSKPTCNNQTPPTHNIWVSCQIMAPARSGRLRSDVTDFDNLILDDTTRRLHSHHITLFLGNQGASNGRTDGNLAEDRKSTRLNSSH